MHIPSLPRPFRVLPVLTPLPRLYCPQAESYRTLAQQSEDKRARAEDELLTTARLAASLEARLAAAGRDNEDLRLEVQVRGIECVLYSIKYVSSLYSMKCVSQGAPGLRAWMSWRCR